MMGKLENEISKIQTFFDKFERISHFKERKESKKFVIDFELNIETYVSQYEIFDIFQFELEISMIKNKINYEIYVKDKTEVPFHPHFKRSNFFNNLGFKRVKWVDFKKTQYDVVVFVKRMIHSLQFDKDYVNPKHSANKKAKDWYLMALYEDNNNFPTDSFFLTQLNSTTQNNGNDKKKFDVKEQQSQFRNLKVTKAKKFDIINKQSYSPKKEALEKHDLEIDVDLKTQNENIKSEALLYITKKAKNEIWNHIQWGNQETSRNKIEQGGILLGNVFYDTNRELQFGIVEEVVAGTNARGNSVYLEMSHEIWAQMLNDADQILDNRKDRPLQIIGWYHTHPNGLDVFMSNTDKNTQCKFFNQDWHYAIVLNPHKQIWKSFVGEKALECKGFFLEDEDINIPDVDQSSINEVSKKKVQYLMLIILAIVIISSGLFWGIQTTQKKNEENTEQNLHEIENECVDIQCIYHLEQKMKDSIDPTKAINIK